MNKSKNKIIHDVIQIILKHAKPERIYLYGSQANGDATSHSDIDIAYDDPDFSDHYKIAEEVGNLSTLIKIDIHNIAKAEERFRTRVKSTGKVLYSSSLKLRAEDGLYNFTNALKQFTEVVDSEQKYKEDGFGDIYLDIIVKRFEFTYEMAWKALKRYLNYIGIEANNPRAVFKEAFAQGIIHDEDIWLDMIEQRNLSSHVYDYNEIKEILDKKEKYKNTFKEMRILITNALEN